MSRDLSYIIPDKICLSFEKHPILHHLFITCCGYYNHSEGHFIKREGIAEYILIYCTDGQGYLRLENKHFSIKKGDVLLIPSYTAHEYGALEENPWSIYWLHFKGTHAPLLFQESLLCVGEQPRLIHYFNQLYPLFKIDYLETNMLKASSYLQLLLCELKELSLNYTKSKKGFQDIESTIEWMRNHLDVRCPVNTLASSINLSKYYFIRKFKSYTSYTPIEYFNRLKIQRACDLLIETNQLISDISDQLGFSNPFYFSERFKEVTGYSPNQFKKIMRTKR
ncbi:hypothetical protein CS063_10195 [Sporanaerobium hydrogeniformans]|uniref:Uncharacterized protein n=1 Tax=Sporanaerobium hydrogeniformans TaxID=3072179 RepID=A0AC61DCG7_9FIRM|nr:AraC family transcriptional regulator [Sporanaerobium hydrogeniformans]PHV70453.1 hypothetical protein CS063_10195 [Sporanaerobium hydrogeniformans]